MDDEPTDGNGNDAVTEGGGGVTLDPRDDTITQLTAALAAAQVTIAGQRAALAAMLLAIPGNVDESDPEPSMTEPDEPDFDDLFTD